MWNRKDRQQNMDMHESEFGHRDVFDCGMNMTLNLDHPSHIQRKMSQVFIWQVCKVTKEELQHAVNSGQEDLASVRGVISTAKETVVMRGYGKVCL